MRQMLALSVAALMVLMMMAEDASAQRRFGGAGVRMGGFHGAGFRGVGYRGVGVGYRGVGIGYRGIGYRGVGIRTAGVWRGGIVGRPGWGVAGRPVLRGAAWRRGWGYPLVAAGVGLGYYGGYYGGYGGYGYPAYNDCLAWNGYAWVNVCYQPYPYGPYGY